MEALGAPTTPSGWALLFSEDFDQASLNSAVWTVTTDGRGGGNQEVQYYTADAVTIGPIHRLTQWVQRPSTHRHSHRQR